LNQDKKGKISIIPNAPLDSVGKYSQLRDIFYSVVRRLKFTSEVGVCSRLVLIILHRLFHYGVMHGEMLQLSVEHIPNPMANLEDSTTK
jgi:hypothetical protein